MAKSTKITILVLICYFPTSVLNSSPILIATIPDMPTKAINRCEMNPTTRQFWVIGDQRTEKIFSFFITNSPSINSEFSPTQPNEINRIKTIDSDYILIAGNKGIKLKLASDLENDVGLPPIKLSTNSISSIVHIKGTEIICCNIEDFRTLYKFLYTSMNEIGNFNDNGMPVGLNEVYHHLNSNFLYLAGDEAYISSVDYSNLQFVKIVWVAPSSMKAIGKGVKKDEIWYITNTSFYIGDLKTQQQQESYINIVTGKIRKFDTVSETDLVFLWDKNTPRLYCFKFVRGGGSTNLVWSYDGQHYNSESSLAFCFDKKTNYIILNKQLTIEIITDPGTGLDCSLDPNCLKCGYVDNFCIECKAGFKIKSGKCEERCGEGFFYNKNENLCKESPCISPKIFDGVSFCQTCTSNQFADEGSNSCVDCEIRYVAGCSTCDHLKCLGCSARYKYNVGLNNCKKCLEFSTKINDTTCLCKEIRCCQKDAEYFLGEACYAISTVPEKWGLYKTELGLTIKKCQKEKCKNCKNNYLICKDPEKEEEQEKPEENIDAIQTKLEESEKYTVLTQEIVSSGALLLGFEGGGGGAASTTQNVRILCLLRFINIDFGDGLENKWENKNEKIKKEIMTVGKKSGGKFARYGFSFYPSILLWVKLLFYFISWMNFVFRKIILFSFGYRILTKTICWYFHLSKKIHFVIFNSCFVELFVLQVRVILHFKIQKETSWFNLFYFFIILLSFFLLCLDLLKFVNVTLKLSQPKIVKILANGTKTLDALDFGHRTNIQKKNLKIDKKSSFSLIKETDFAIEINLLSEFQTKNLKKNFFKTKIHKLLHYLRLGLMILILVSLQQIPTATIFLLAIIELIGLIFTIYTQFNYKYMLWLPFVHKIFTNVGMLVFLFSISFMTFKGKITGEEQSIILILFMLLSLIEKIFLVLRIAVGIGCLIWYKIRKSEKKEFVRRGEEVFAVLKDQTPTRTMDRKSKIEGKKN